MKDAELIDVIVNCLAYILKDDMTKAEKQIANALVRNEKAIWLNTDDGDEFQPVE